MTHRPHHLHDPHIFEVCMPVRRSIYWEPSKSWHDRVPIIPPFSYEGDVGRLIAKVSGGLIGISALTATFGPELCNDGLTARQMLGGAAEVKHIHELVLRALDSLAENTDGSDGLGSRPSVRHRDGRLLGGFTPLVLRPSVNIDYAHEVSLESVVLARHVDAKGASRIAWEESLA